MLQLDYLEVIQKEAGKTPYTSTDVKNFVRHSITLNYGAVTDIAPDIKLTFHNAGHILGSAIAHFHIGDGLYNIAFTGDFNYSKSRLFSPAANQFPRLETVFMESTYGGSNDIQAPRKEAEARLYEVVNTHPLPGRESPHPCFCRGEVPGGHAGPRGGDALCEDPEGERLPGRDDPGGDGHPHDVSRVPERRPEEPNLP